MAQNDCENCHKRAKFGTHKYCGLTCASQAAAKQARTPAAASSLPNVAQPSGGHTNRALAAPNAPQKAILCAYCGKKPKFRNSDYCTKSCAALATTARGGNQATAVQGKQPAKPNLPNVVRHHHVSQNNSGHNVKKAAQAKPQVTVTQDDDSSDYPPSDSASDDEVDEGEETDLSAYPTDSEEEPAAPSAPFLAPPPTVTKAGKTNVPAAKPAATCAIPHCGKPVHVDKTGVSTGYCSIKHREESVTLKLKAPCILCKRYPQSDADYFCSKTCRNQAMLKTR